MVHPHLRPCDCSLAPTYAANRRGSSSRASSQLRFNRRVQKQKRAIVVAVRSASGLPVGDPISRKCHPYVIITVLEPSRCLHGCSGIDVQKSRRELRREKHIKLTRMPTNREFKITAVCNTVVRGESQTLKTENVIYFCVMWKPFRLFPFFSSFYLPFSPVLTFFSFSVVRVLR